MNLRAIVVDDEPLAVRRLQIALSRIGGIELLGTASEGARALELISASSPDLILLDIKMPIMDGFELVKALVSTPVIPEIIFVTAHSDFAIQAFEVGAIGYVLKPIGEDRLRVAVEAARVKLRTRHAEERLADLTSLLDTLRRGEALCQTPFDQEFWIDRGTTIERIAVGNIDWFEAAGDYVAIHCEQREHLLHDSLTSLVQRLNPHDFARVHRKAIVRLQAVQAVERGKLGALFLRLASGHRVPVSRTYRRPLVARLRTARADGSGEYGLFGDDNMPKGEAR